MSNLIFASISPHPPLLLPDIGSEEDKKQVKNTLRALEILGKKFKNAKPETVIISSPHEDWGFNVPLHFLARDFEGKIQQFLIGLESPFFYYEKGKKVYNSKFKMQNSKFSTTIFFGIYY